MLFVNTFSAPLFLSCLVFALGKRNAPERYAVVLDAGSSGSRLHVYKWQEVPECCELPAIREAFNHKVTPGISSLVSDLRALEGHISDLITKAKEKVHKNDWSSTPIYLMATAGMRLLIESKADDVVDEIHMLLSNNRFNPFEYKKGNARILSGEEEGAFMWITVNYLRGFFTPDSGLQAVGIFELGGASTQIAFVPAGSILADKFPVRVAGKFYPLYVHSYLYYGQNYARMWINEQLFKANPGSSVIDDPCMLRGDVSHSTISNKNITFSGQGRPDLCEDFVQQYVYKADPSRCYPKPCAIGIIYQPSIRETKTFYALSSFVYAPSVLGSLDKNKTLVPVRLLEDTREYCTLHIDEAVNKTGVSRAYLSTYCLMGLYIPTLLTKAYGLENDTTQVIASQGINGQQAKWALGAVIYERGKKEILCKVQPAVVHAGAPFNYRHTSYRLLITTTILVFMINLCSRNIVSYFIPLSVITVR